MIFFICFSFTYLILLLIYFCHYFYIIYLFFYSYYCCCFCFLSINLFSFISWYGLSFSIIHVCTYSLRKSQALIFIQARTFVSSYLFFYPGANFLSRHLVFAIPGRRKVLLIFAVSPLQVMRRFCFSLGSLRFEGLTSTTQHRT